MNREYHRWYSHRLGRDMELLVFGHTGEPVLVFPTSMGRFYEFEDRGMVAALSPRIEAGHVTLFCVDSVDRESWYRYEAHPHDRIRRHLQYEQYVLAEVLPLMRQHNPRPDPRVAVTGCSLGAFHAGLIALRHPTQFSRLLGFSGKYENSRFLRGYSDMDAYLTNPLAFIPNLTDRTYLEPMRRMDIRIVSGSTDPHIHEARDLSRALWDKGVPNNLDVWDGWVHDWPYWEAMIAKHL